MPNPAGFLSALETGKEQKQEHAAKLQIAQPFVALAAGQGDVFKEHFRHKQATNDHAEEAADGQDSGILPLDSAGTPEPQSAIGGEHGQSSNDSEQSPT